MASDPEDMIEAERVQRELPEQVLRCHELIENGRQLFMLSQADPKRDSGTQA